MNSAFTRPIIWFYMMVFWSFSQSFPNKWKIVKPPFWLLAVNKVSGTVKLSHCLVSHAQRTRTSYSHFFFVPQKKMAKILLYSNENINIRHQASHSPSLLASHLNISYLQDTAQLESYGLLSPAQDTTGKSKRCHTSSQVICHERSPFLG